MSIVFLFLGQFSSYQLANLYPFLALLRGGGDFIFCSLGIFPRHPLYEEGQRVELVLWGCSLALSRHNAGMHRERKKWTRVRFAILCSPYLNCKSVHVRFHQGWGSYSWKGTWLQFQLLSSEELGNFSYFSYSYHHKELAQEDVT